MERIDNWLWLDKAQTASTNDDALTMCADMSSAKFIVSAREQTSGRGRRGRTWVSLKGNLFFSLALPFVSQNVGQLVCLTAISLLQTISELDKNKKIQIKWPNDVLLEDKKISGILLEKGKNDYFIIGVGVNLEASPAENILYPTTNLKAEGINIDRLTFLRSYIRCFDENLGMLAKEGFEPFKQQWMKSAKGINEKIAIKTETTELYGKYIGIGDLGELLLADCGQIKKIYAGDIFFEG